MPCKDMTACDRCSDATGARRRALVQRSCHERRFHDTKETVLLSRVKAPAQAS